MIAGIRHIMSSHSPLQQDITEKIVGSNTRHLKCRFCDIFQDEVVVTTITPGVSYSHKIVEIIEPKNMVLLTVL